jgi:methylmalonyl-CoA/ethylmalonyl-CoA epimerase
MSISLNQLGQVMLPVDNVDLAELFYTERLELRKLYRFGDFLFFDCAGVRLLLEKSTAQPFVPSPSIFYFRVADFSLVYRKLQERGVEFTDQPHLTAPMEDHDLWMAFFKDSAGNTLALMQEAPKGYQPELTNAF